MNYKKVSLKKMLESTKCLFYQKNVNKSAKDINKKENYL